MNILMEQVFLFIQWEISPNPWVCMIWDLVAQNGPMTGMRQIITLILR
nr:Uncharacterised protein [Klebsiella pneumoniae]